MKYVRTKPCPHCLGTGRENKFNFDYLRIGTFVPSGLAFNIPSLCTIDQIYKELIDWSNTHRLYWIQPRLEIRDPYMNEHCIPRVEEMHIDGLTHPPIPETLAMWCNQDPTEILVYETGEDVHVDPFEVILINNTKCRHRRKSVPQAGRWFFKIDNAEPLPQAA